MRFFDIIKLIKSNSGIKKTVITTNGYHLDKIASKIKDSGLNGINISIDSLNRETFKKITSHDRLPEILRGIEELQKLNFKNIKVNAVLLRGVNDSEKDFNEWSQFIKNNETHSLGIFQIFITEIWFRLFIDNKPSSFRDIKLNEFIYETN